MIKFRLKFLKSVLLSSKFLCIRSIIQMLWGKKLVWEHVLSRKKSLTQNACGVPTKLQSIAGSGLKSGL